jgi:hypothetical protein
VRGEFCFLNMPFATGLRGARCGPMSERGRR